MSSQPLIEFPNVPSSHFAHAAVVGGLGEAEVVVGHHRGHGGGPGRRQGPRG